MTKNCHVVRPALRVGQRKLSTAILSALVGSCRDQNRHDPTAADAPEIPPYISPMSQSSHMIGSEVGRDVPIAPICSCRFAFIRRPTRFVKFSNRLPLHVVACNCMQRSAIPISPPKTCATFTVRTVLCAAQGMNRKREIKNHKSKIHNVEAPFATFVYDRPSRWNLRFVKKYYGALVRAFARTSAHQRAAHHVLQKTCARFCRPHCCAARTEK
jgi:hypothetical protein